MFITPEHTFHRGDRDTQWFMQDALDLETTMRSVAHEITRGLQLNPSHAIIPPPDPYCTEEDEQIAEMIRETLTQQNGHKTESGKLYIVAWTLTVPTAVLSAQIIHDQCTQRGVQFGGIGCGSLMVSNEHQGEYSLFSDQDWIRALDQTPFIPLYRCSAYPEDCLQ